jgi:hypothetical protein
LRDGCRARVVFPAEMRARIDERAARLNEKLAPDSELESMIVHEIARAGVQMDVSQEQLIEDEIRVSEKTDSDWHEERTREAGRLGARLAADPSQVKDQLEASLHGVNWLLDRWRSLSDEAIEMGGLDDPQRQLAFDLLGVPVTLRRGTSKVPAGDNVAGLKALCAREIKRLETRLVLELEGRDMRARAKAGLGLPMAASDTITRRIKSNFSRAHKRLVWAVDTFNRLRMGVAPETIIDPETRQPLRAGATAQEQPQPAQAQASAPAPPPAAEPDPPTAPPQDGSIPLPDGVADEDKEMLLLVGATLRSMARQGLLKPPGGGPPPA